MSLLKRKPSEPTGRHAALSGILDRLQAEEDRRAHAVGLLPPAAAFGLFASVLAFPVWLDVPGPSVGVARVAGFMLSIVGAWIPFAGATALFMRRDGDAMRALSQLKDPALLAPLVAGTATLNGDRTHAAVLAAVVRMAEHAGERDREAMVEAVPALAGLLACGHPSADGRIFVAVLRLATRLRLLGLEAEAERLVAGRWPGAKADTSREAAREYLEACAAFPRPDGAATPSDAANPPPFTQDDLARARVLARKLRNGLSRHRRQAEAALVRMGPPGSQALLEYAEETRRISPRGARWAAGCNVARVALAAALVWLGLLLAPEGIAWTWLTMLAALLSLPLSAVWWGNSTERDIVAVLARMDDRRAVGMLLEVHQTTNETVRSNVSEALRRLLPQLTPVDRGLLTPQQYARLLGLLKLDYPELVMAALKGLEQIGSEADIPYVEDLATGGYIGPDAARVRAAATECLQYVRIRLEKERPARTLLRPAMPTPASTTLVRPAGGGNPAELTMLVQPVNAVPDERSGVDASREPGAPPARNQRKG